MHVTHLHENKFLTFGELKEVLALAVKGELNQTTEKFDGMNLMFSWDGSLRAARGKGDITHGGLSVAELESKFAAYPAVKEAFVNGFKILEGAVSSLSRKDLEGIFQQGQIWYSLELVYPTVSNTINYDANSIVFHGWPVLKLVNRQVVKSDDDSGVELLTQRVKQMQNAVSQTGWRVAGPNVVLLKGIADGTLVESLFSRLERIMSEADVSDSSTLQDYLLSRAQQVTSTLNLPPNLAHSLALRLVRDPNAKTLTQLTKTAGRHSELVRDMVAQSDTLVKRWMSPIEVLISDFAIEILRGMKSALIADSEAEVQRLRTRVANAINVIKSSDNEVALSVLRAQLEKLRSVENIASSAEGVVFIYKGNAYKFVGSFAPAHQILTLFRYGRNGVKFNPTDID